MFALVFPGESRHRNLNCNIRIPLPSTHFSVHYSLSYYQKLCNEQVTRQTMSLKRNTEVISRKHHRLVCLQPQIFQDANHVRRIVLSFGSVPLHHIFINCLINGTIDFLKKSFDFVYNFVLKSSHSKKNPARCNHKCTLVFVSSTRYSCRILMRIEFSP